MQLTSDGIEAMREFLVAKAFHEMIKKTRWFSASDDLCPYCHETLHIVWVHGHGQCSKCGTNIAPCCDGEQGGDHGM